ncbi:hypothetical protein HK102_012610 [Quaeritorhiza haematococci]|nr:hypothetical protein HK102_012610 [Quaeritorhiza haematococci]
MNTWFLALFAFLALAVLTTPTLAQTPTAATNVEATPMAMPATSAAAAETPEPAAASNANMRMAVEEVPAELPAAPFFAQAATGMTPATMDSGDISASQYYPCYWYYAGPYYYCYYNMWGPYYYCYVSDIGCCCQPIYY